MYKEHGRWSVDILWYGALTMHRMLIDNDDGKCKFIEYKSVIQELVVSTTSAIMRVESSIQHCRLLLLISRGGSYYYAKSSIVYPISGR